MHPHKTTSTIRLGKNEEVLIYRKAILVESIALPAMNDHQRVTVKIKTPDNKSGWKRVTIPLSFLRNPEVDKKGNLASPTVGDLKRMLQSFDDSLPICVAHSSNSNENFAPSLGHLSLENRVLNPAGALDEKASGTTQPMVIINS